MINVAQLKESTRLELRKRCLRSLFSFCVAVMGYDDVTDTLHRDVCEFIEDPAKRKQLTLPRGFLKTCLASIAYPIWIALKREEADEFPEGINPNDALFNLGPNIRILVASNVVTNANKIIGMIKKVYERNQALMVLFPEVIPPDFTKCKWSDFSACINRTEDFTESTFEAAGVGGSAVSRHYDIIIEDDLIYAKKDDLTGKELQPSQEDIDKAIGWHKLAMSLFVPRPHVVLFNIGTRWAKHDLVDYIRTNEKQYLVKDVSVVDAEGNPTWPEQFGLDKLREIRDAQGPYMYATQYLNNPMSPEEMLFKVAWLQYYTSASELPKSMRIFTTVDLAGWGTAKRSRESRAVILTCGWCHNNHMWVLHYDVGKFDPSEVIDIMAKHWKLFKPEMIAVEEIYYQKALAHFARKAMERGDVPWMTIRGVKPEGSESKELRIRALEPIASNLAVHCKSTHREFIMEFSEYVPNSGACVKDILDAAAYQIQVARPGEVQAVNKWKDRNDFLPVGTMDSFLKWAWGRTRNLDRFGNKGVEDNPFEEKPDILVNVTDPYYEEEPYFQ